MKLTFLGTGTSTGVPQLGCDCDVCASDNPRDTRMRSSALLEAHGISMLIDCGPDFYLQMLRHNRMSPIDMLLLTHHHYDHMGGIDDLRPYCTADGFPIYCSDVVNRDIRRRIPYSFSEHPYPGVPRFDIHELQPYRAFDFRGIEITPLPVIHGEMPILGYKFGTTLAYITDASHLPAETIDHLKGIDTLVINALRIKPHHSHMSLSETLAAISEIKPRKAYLIHMSHQIGRHDDVERLLPPNIHLAYDGLEINIPD